MEIYNKIKHKKNSNSNGKIIGLSIITVLLMIASIGAFVLIAPATLADEIEDLYEEPIIPACDRITPNPNPILEESCGIDIVLVLDSSGSMSSSTDIPKVKTAANAMVDALLPSTNARIGVVEFDWDVVPPSLGLSTNPTEIKNRINNISSGGNTNWAAALIEADSILGTGNDSMVNDTLIIIITDGQPNEPDDAELAALIAANNAKSNGTRIVAIGIHSTGSGAGYNLDNLKMISGPLNVTIPPGIVTKDTDVIDGSVDELGDILFDLTTALCDLCEHDPPVINKIVTGHNITGASVGQPNIDYFGTPGLEIIVEVTDESYYEVFYNISDVDEPNPTGILWFTSDNPVCQEPITLTEDCTHYVKIWVIDECENIAWDNETFCIDTTPPLQTIEFGEPKNTTANILIGIGPNTPVWLNSSDLENEQCCNVGSKNLSYKIFVNNTQIGEPVTVEDQSPQDMDQRIGYVSVLLTDWENCLHQIHWACRDYLDNGNSLAEYVGDYDHKDFWVDARAPVSETEYSTPHFLEHYGLVFTWLNCSGVKYINVTDTGCTHPYVYPNATAGVEKVVWTVGVDEDIDGQVEFSYSGIVYDNDANDTNPVVGEINMMIPFHEDCLHIIQHTVYDKFGNWAHMPKQHVKVDCTPPTIVKMVGENCTGCGMEPDDYCVTTNTTISFYAYDTGCYWQQEPAHEGIGLDCVKYRIWDATNGWSNYTEDCDLDGEWNIRFTEECIHYLEIVAIDLLGNTIIDNETFYVDDSPPEIIKTVGDPNCTGCGMDPDDYCVTTDTLITIEANDLGCCPCSDVFIEFRIWNNETGWTRWVEYEGQFHFMEECQHYLEIRASDCLGNTAYDNETFYVDDSPPELIKTVGDPNCTGCGIGEGNYCVTTDTLITLDANEIGCCPCSDVTIEYKIYYNGTYSEWIEYTEPFSFTEECKHALIVRVYDCLGNGMDDKYWDHETFYVDDTPPEIIKTVGDPNCTGCGMDPDDYCVTTDTLITLDAIEQGCCPCPDVTLQYKIIYNESSSGWINYTEPFRFTEECEHELIIRAVDCLGNTAWDNETFYVDDSPPELIKTVGEPNCPIEGTDNYCVTTDTLITLNATEKGCCPCSDVTIEYQIHYGEKISDWITYTGPFNFTEECEHTLVVRVYDCLGNGMDDQYWDIETFYVDDSAPKINKTVGEPNCAIDGTDDYCVTMDTIISATAENQGCCVNQSIFMDYRIWTNGTWTNWMPYTPGDPIQFTEECMHYLEIRAKDCLGNTEIDNETFYVDETPPTIKKNVGEPNCPIEGTDDYCVTTDTIINATATNAGCCINDIITMDYRIWYNGTWTDWMKYAPGSPITFEEECMHYLEIRAKDCLGNTVVDNETFYVDDTPPKITKDVGEPNIPINNVDVFVQIIDYWVNCQTPITINATDEGCCGQLTYVAYSINHGPWIAINLTDLPKTIDFNESCTHTLDIKAMDCLGNTMYHNETFKVDCEPPESYKLFEGPTYPEDLNQNGIIDNDDEEFYWLQDHGTQIILRAMENKTDNITCDVGIDHLYVELWWDEDINGTIDPDELVWARTIIDDDANDSETGCEGIIEYRFNITEDCLHEIRWYAVDKLGNKELTHIQQHRVDSQPPDSVKTIGEPKWWDEEKGIWWVRTNTDFNLKSTDTIEPCAVGTSVLYVVLEHSCENDSYEAYSMMKIYDNDSNDLNNATGIIEYNFTLPMEGWWRITWYAVDLLGNTENLHYQYHFVDETPPHVIILKPTDGWYSPGGVIPSVVVSEDLPSPHGICPFSEAVGIEQGQQGKAWLIDIFPEFKIVELDTTNFLYDRASHEYIGNIKIPVDANITDGAALFVAGSQDRLGNNWTSIHELIHAYVIQGLAECTSECCLIEFLGDVLADFIADQNIVFVGIDGTPPVVEFDESEETGAPIPDVIYPGVLEIKANISDVLSGITAGSPCYIKLNGIMLGSLPYDKFTETCHGWIVIPNVLPNMENVPLTIEAYDDVGNMGMDTILVDYHNALSVIIPTVRIESPDDHTTHNDTLHLIISADDDTTPTEELVVKVQVLREDDPALIFLASYDNISGNFHLYLDISEYQDGAQLVLQAFAIDEDGYSGDTEPRTYWVESNICYDQWMHDGWNLMNLKCVCDDRSVPAVLQSIDGLYDMVYEVGTGHIWIPEGFDNIGDMTEGNWYWIHMNNTQDRLFIEDCIIPEEPENTAPIANDDFALMDCSFYENETNHIEIDVLQNDTDADLDPISLLSFDSVSAYGGTITRNDNGTPMDLTDDTLTYTIPNFLFSGEDYFQYTIDDGNGGSDTAIVYVTVEYCGPR